MKQKVLFALIALMSFMTSWAATEPALQIPETVQEEPQFSFYLSENPVVIGGEQAPAIPTVTMSLKVFDEPEEEYAEFTQGGLYTFADGKLTKVEAIDNEKLNNYYIQVSYDNGETAFVPFKTVKRVKPEIVWNRKSYEASVNGEEESPYGLYEKYLVKYPWSYVWDNTEKKCWYPTTTGEDRKAEVEALFDSESGRYGYPWEAIYTDYLKGEGSNQNKLLEDFPVIGYAHNEDTKVDMRFVQNIGTVTEEEWVNPVRDAQQQPWHKVMENGGFAVASWSEFVRLVGLVEGQHIYLDDQESDGLERGDVYYMDGNDKKKATDISDVYEEGDPIYNIRIELSSTEEFASQEDLVAAAEEITYNDWTLDETSDIYLGDVKYPAIAIDAVDVDGKPVDIDAYDNDNKVIVKFYTDADLTKEVDEMIHAGTYYVQVYVPGVAEEEEQDPQVEPAPAAEEDPLEGYVTLGDPQKFTITKNTLEVVLQQIYMPYGSSLDDLKPVWIVKKSAEDMTATNTIVVENLGDIIKGTGWAAGEEAETVEPNQVRNYTTSSQPKAYVGRTYDEKGNVVEEGFEDYIATTNTSSANIVTTKGTLTVDIIIENLEKVYGFDDPEYKFTATTQSGADVTKDVKVTREGKGTAAGEAVGSHNFIVEFDTKHYDLVLKVNSEEADKAQLKINPFNLAQDNTEEGGYGYGDPDYKEKFNIEKPEVIYNGETQFPDPVIKFNHELLGEVTLSNFDKWPATGSTTGRGKRYKTDDYTYVHGGATYLYTLEGEEGKVPGSYSGYTKSVTRNAETAEVEEATTIKVDAVEGEGKNFTGSKTQAWAIQPAPLAVKVKNYTGENAKAYLSEATFEMETVGESDVVGYDQATSEPEHDKAALLAGLAAAIAEANGFEGYTKGDAASETPYTIKVKAEAQTAVAVIMSMKNYALDFTNSDGSLEIKKIMLALKATDQTIDYPAPADEKYTSPVADTEVKESTVTIVEGVLPEGYELGDLVTLEQKTTKVGANDGGIELKKNENVDASIEFTVADGKLTINPLAEIRLSYENMAQALEDHKGQTVDVYLSNRKIKEDQWYAMVLPFEFSVPQFSNKLYYGVVDLLDTENASDDVRFKLTVGTVPANTPFMFKLAKDPAKADQAEAMTADQLATICFEDVTIGDGEFAYNDAAKAPFSVDAANHKFVGLYPTVATSGANKFGKVGMEANEWFISTADGGFYSGAGNPNQKMLQTDAFISFPTAEAGAKARFFIEDADGTVTAIEGIDAEVPAEGNADAAREGWYTVNGVKLNAQPTQKGLYIFNGKKVYVK